MDKLDILKAVHRLIPWEGLYDALPDVTREQVDSLFREFSEHLARRADAGPEATSTPDGEALTCARGATVVLNTDGASRGNPGPAGIGVVISLPDGTELLSWGEGIGRATSNVAEYRALVAGLEKARELGAARVELRSDSELLVRQLNGIYRVKSPRLKPLYEQVRNMLGRFEGWKARHVPRGRNTAADSLASRYAKALKRRGRR